MAGHSKWANIKHRKGKADAKKGKMFSRVTKEIISAVKQLGPDPKSNPKLRAALQKAKEVNLPNENIERNIKKGAKPEDLNLKVSKWVAIKIKIFIQKIQRKKLEKKQGNMLGFYFNYWLNISKI